MIEHYAVVAEYHMNAIEQGVVFEIQSPIIEYIPRYFLGHTGLPWKIKVIKE